MGLNKICVKVAPRAKKQKIQCLSDGTLKVYLISPPVDGKANCELIELLASHYNIKKSAVQILVGHKTKHKIVGQYLRTFVQKRFLLKVKRLTGQVSGLELLKLVI